MQLKALRNQLHRSVPVIVISFLLCSCGNGPDNQSAKVDMDSAACVRGDKSACDISGRALSPTAASGSGLASAAVRRLFEEDTHRNVGKSLPSGIHAINPKGNSVDLKATLSALNAPTILVRVEPGCSPCDDLLDYVQSNATQYSAGHGTRLVVIEARGTGAKYLKQHELPDGITLLKAEGRLDTGFLAGHISPAVFFFDKDQKLIARRAGLTTPEDFLHFPE